MELNEEEKKNFITFFEVLKNNAVKERYIDWDNGAKNTNHILNYLKESKCNWNDITLIGHFLIELSLQEAILSLNKEDINTKILKNCIEVEKDKNWSNSLINRDLMLLTSAYKGKPLDNIKADISNSDFISCNLKDRFQILRKYGFKCVYCGRSPPEVKLQLDHVDPKKNGGRNIDSNFVPACFECNNGKREHLLDKEESDLIKLRFFEDS